MTRNGSSFVTWRPKLDVVEGNNERPVNAGSVAQILQDLCDLGDLRPLGGDPPRWELA
jgi:hypothetical protein